MGPLVPRGAHATYSHTKQPVEKTLSRSEAYDAPHRETAGTSSTIVLVEEYRESQMTPAAVQAEQILCAEKFEGAEKDGGCTKLFEPNGDIEQIRTGDNNGSIAMHLAKNFSETGNRRRQPKRRDRRKTTKKEKSENCSKIDSDGKVGHFESPGENGPAKEEMQNNGIYCYSFTLK